MRICIVTPSALGSNPRVVKEATALQGAGFDVHVICTKILSSLEFCDQDVLTSSSLQTKRIEVSGTLSRRLERARQIGLRGAFAISGIPGLADKALSAVTRKLIKHASSLAADLYIAHYPAALPAAAIAACRHQALYAFDAEDFHLGELPEGAEHERERRIIRMIEGRYLSGCAFITASSPGIASAYAKAYGIQRPTVVLNVSPRVQAPPGPTSAGSTAPGPSVYWFSQTIAPDRGLQCAVRAIGYARTKPHLYLRGTPSDGFLDILRMLAREVGAEERIHILSPAPPSQMESMASTYDLGLVSEIGHTPNRRLALTNKQFTYLMAGIPVVMSDIPAHCAMAKMLGDASRVYPVDDAAALAGTLDTLLGDSKSLAAARGTAWRLGQERFNWDLERTRILEHVQEVLGTDLRNTVARVANRGERQSCFKV